jgi:hypothetical protein
MRRRAEGGIDRSTGSIAAAPILAPASPGQRLPERLSGHSVSADVDDHPVWSWRNRFTGPVFSGIVVGVKLMAPLG